MRRIVSPASDGYPETAERGPDIVTSACKWRGNVDAIVVARAVRKISRNGTVVEALPGVDMVTFGPAWRAAKLPPAEAVRYTE
jgi:hypothetical protein